MGREGHDLRHRLEAELPAISSWAVRGAHDLFHAHPASKWPIQLEGYKFKRTALAASAPIEEWLFRRTRPGTKVSAAYAHADYLTYHERLGLPPLSLKAFSTALQNSSAHPTKGRERLTEGGNAQAIYYGIALKPPAHTDEDLFFEIAD